MYGSGTTRNRYIPCSLTDQCRHIEWCKGQAPAEPVRIEAMKPVGELSVTVGGRPRLGSERGLTLETTSRVLADIDSIPRLCCEQPVMVEQRDTSDHRDRRCSILFQSPMPEGVRRVWQGGGIKPQPGKLNQTYQHRSRKRNPATSLSWPKRFYSCSPRHRRRCRRHPPNPPR